MKKLICLSATLVLSLSLQAQEVPSPDRLLPGDTLAVLTIPDMAQTRRLALDSPTAQLWNDPSIKAFKEKFLAKFQEEVIQPFEADLGIQLTNYLHLAQGQITVAITGNGLKGNGVTQPGLVLLIDAKDQRSDLEKALNELREKLQADGAAMRTERIRGVEFTVLIFEQDEILDEEDTNDFEQEFESEPLVDEMYIGQSGSLLLVAEFKTDLEKILSLRSGGPVLSLAESTDFRPDYNRSFRDAQIYGWLNFEDFHAALEETFEEDGEDEFAMVDPSAIMRALGLTGMKTLAVSGSLKSDGEHLKFDVGVPESERRGLFRMIGFEPKDAAPPAFVPDDALSFLRYRVNMRDSWRALEAMISEISPEMGSVFKLSLGMIGKEQDPTFDLERNLLDNLGDDMMGWTKAPRENTVEALSQQPEIILLGSPNAEQLASAVKTLVSMVPPDIAPLNEREFLGRQVWSLEIPTEPQFDPSQEVPTQTFAFTSNRGYFVLATDEALLEEFLRSSDGGTATLISRPGLRFASETVGGMGTGLFGFSDDRATMRFVYQFLTSEEDGQTDAMTGFNQFMAAAGIYADEGELAEWVDVSLLPPFERLEKYFNYTVYTGAMERDGLHFHSFTPKPQGLR